MTQIHKTLARADKRFADLARDRELERPDSLFHVGLKLPIKVEV